MDPLALEIILICVADDAIIIQSKIGQHPVIVLTDLDANGRVKIATMSHKHPTSTPQYPTSRYNLPEHPVTGEGTISVGEPKVIDHKLLRRANPPKVMGSDDFELLLADIRKCSMTLLSSNLFHWILDENTL